MSYSFLLVTSQAGILPATYPVTVTASESDVSQPLAVQFSIIVEGAPLPPPPTDGTVRPLADLLTVLWADGQAAKSLTAQDVRDTIVSLALQRGTFASLPTSNVGLPTGRVWVDNGVLRVNI